MKRIRKKCLVMSVLALSVLLTCSVVLAQEVVVLSENELSKVVPANFYFEGQVAPTQMHNAAAARFDGKRNVVAALVDTSGYASSIRSRYEGLLIADSRVSIGGAEVQAGAYGFGFTEDMKLNIFDVGGKGLHTVAATRDNEIRSPRPLAMVKVGKDLRLYRGRNFVVIAMK